MEKVRKVPVSLMYKMFVLLWKLRVFINVGRQEEMYFKCDPTSLEDYLLPIAEPI